jgi:glycosyltransferase involved in cell wall biosynthesis
MNSSLQFSVIIPTYHRNDLLAKCLDCLAPGIQSLPIEQYEVIVTDDGSEITAESMIREQYPWAKWVSGPRRGPAANRNNGASYAQGEWLAFTDDDCLPEPNWLINYAQAIDGSALALEGAIHPLGNPHQDLVECPVNLVGGCFWSANIAVQRSLFEKIGGFDANYPLAAYEDQDLQLRLFPLTEITFVANSCVLHPVRNVSIHEVIYKIPKICCAWAYHVKKHEDVLGYETPIKLILKSYKVHAISAMRNLRHLYLKSAFTALVSLLICPLLTYFFYLQH